MRKIKNPPVLELSLTFSVGRKFVLILILFFFQQDYKKRSCCSHSLISLNSTEAMNYLIRLLWSLALVVNVTVNGNPGEDEPAASSSRRGMMNAVGVAALEEDWLWNGSSSDDDQHGKRKKGETRRPGFSARKRTRRTVRSLYDEMGPLYFRRAYRMDYDSFVELHRITRPLLMNKGKKRKGAPNGFIDSTIRLSCALRYFAGGSSYDISVAHGISHSEVFNSIWKVVDAVQHSPELSFAFPEAHADQRMVAEGFKSASDADFENCVGCIDGMLLWMEKPNLKECEEAECGQLKFFCGRKHKYGYNMQAICDSHCRFMDVCIKHPAATSDYLAFTTSNIYYKLENNSSFLAEGLSIYGDNAYVNNQYMTTPVKGVKEGLLDDYNFYQSQVSWTILFAKFGDCRLHYTS